MEKLCGIYCIENLVNGKKYVGQSTNVKKRLKQHKSELNSKSHFNTHLQNAWNLHGKDSFNFYVIMECEADDLDYYESYYIALWNLQNRDCGYNNESGGNKNKHLSQETKDKISERQRIIMNNKYDDENERVKDREYLLKYYAEHPEGKEIRKNANIKLFQDNPELVEVCRDASRKYWSDEKNIEDRRNIMIERYKNQEERELQRQRSLDVWKTEEHRQNQRNGMINSKVARSVICIETGDFFPVCSDAMRWLGKSVYACGSILNVCRGKRKTAYGYHWKFADDMQNQNISSENIL